MKKGIFLILLIGLLACSQEEVEPSPSNDNKQVTYCEVGNDDCESENNADYESIISSDTFISIDFETAVSMLKNKESGIFYFGYPGQYTENARYIREWQVVALVTDCTPDGMATLSLRNKFTAGDTLELVGPDTKPMTFTAPVMEDEAGDPLMEPKNPQMVFRMRLPRQVPPWTILRAARDLSAKS